MLRYRTLHNRLVLKNGCCHRLFVERKGEACAVQVEHLRQRSHDILRPTPMHEGEAYELDVSVSKNVEEQDIAQVGEVQQPDGNPTKIVLVALDKFNSRKSKDM